MNKMERINEFAKELGDNHLTQVTTAYANKVYLGEKYVYKVAVSKERIEKGDHLKEKAILKILHEKLNNKLLYLIPSYIDDRKISDDMYIQVHTRLKGEPPLELNQSQAILLGQFLADLHNINNFTSITEFVEPEEKFSNFFSYITTSLKKFQKKLETVVSEKDLELINLASKLVIDSPLEDFNKSLLCLVHKDIYTNNLLVHNGEISGVIDWEAAQTAPPEWELAIIMQRFPLLWEYFIEGYKTPFNYDLLRICGITQSLRYWKSFPKNADFVAEQRNFIIRMVNNELK